MVWVGSVTSRIISSNPLPPDQAASSPAQSGLEHFKGWEYGWRWEEDHSFCIVANEWFQESSVSLDLCNIYQIHENISGRYFKLSKMVLDKARKWVEFQASPVTVMTSISQVPCGKYVRYYIWQYGQKCILSWLDRERGKAPIGAKLHSQVM